jgi:hypothetical protein
VYTCIWFNVISLTESFFSLYASKGHTTCSVCAESLHGNNCPFCATAIDQKVRFHTDNKEPKEEPKEEAKE